MHPLTLAQQHVYGFEGTTSEVIFVAGFAGLAMVAMVVAKLSFRHWLLVAVLCATSIAPSVDAMMQGWNPTWMLPLQLHHSGIHLGLSVLLTVLVLFGGRASVRLIPMQGVLMLLMALYAGVMQFFHDDATTAIEAIGFALATIPCVVLAGSRSTRTFDECLTLLRTMMLASVAWTFCCSVQFVLNPRYLVSFQGRFLGMLGNAQHAAALVSFMAVIALWLLMHDPKTWAKVLWVALLAINLLFLGWTGSRTGGLMFVVGLTAILYARIGKAVLLLPVAMLLLWGLALLASTLDIGANLERFVSMENTREGVVAGQLQAIIDSPLVGVGWRDETIGTENSYLGGFAAYGIVYFLLTLFFVVVCMWQCFRFTAQRRHLPIQQRPLVDLFCAFNLMYFAGAGFEGFILARSFAPQIMLLLFASIGVWLRDEIAYCKTEEAEDELAFGEEADEYPRGAALE